VGRDAEGRRPEAGARPLSPHHPTDGPAAMSHPGDVGDPAETSDLDSPSEVTPADRVVRLVPDIPAVHRRFDYTVPATLGRHVGVGSRVRIDLQGRRVGAWVVEEGVTPPAGVVPKPIALSSGEGPPPSVVALTEWAAWRWAGPMSSFLGTASPARVVRRPGRKDTGAPDQQGGAEPPGGQVGSAAVASPGGASVEMVAAALGNSTVPTVVRLAPTLDAVLIVQELVHRLGPEGLLVLAPSHLRAAQVADRLRQLGGLVALLPDAWEAAATGRRVVVGTRAAAWAPLSLLRGAVILDAHDEAYREERSPTWSAVDVTLERGRRDGAPVLLVSSCPTVSLLENSALVTTVRDVERRGWPVVEVVDRTGDDPRTGLFSERLAGLLRSVLDQPTGRVVCILNRTGRARLLACAHCGALARCTHCGGPVAQSTAAGELSCSRCGLTRPAICAECDSTRLKLLRIGVARATEELSALVGVEAVEVSRDATEPVDDRARLVVGTEAALHRVAHAEAVAFLDFDQHLMAPRFGAGEEALALLARASRLVGGRGGAGRLLLQTRIPDHEVLRAAVHGDPSLLAGPERELRSELGLPPFSALALVGGPGAETYADGLRLQEGITVSSPSPDRRLVRAADHQQLCDALAAVPRPAARLRVEVDPTNV
jgi:primosomal protein N' (replication factor Y)